MSNDLYTRSIKWITVSALCVCWLLVSCGGGGTGTTTPTLQSITVSPANLTVAAGLTQQYTATGNYSDGSSHTLNGVTWATSDTTLATISSGGLVTTLKQGTVTVSATLGAATGSTSLVVGAPNLLSLTVSPQNATVAAGLTQQFAATGSFTDGSSKAVGNVTWSVSNQTLATVNSNGLLTTLHPGSITVTAAVGAISGTAPFNISPPIPEGLNIMPGNDHVLIAASPSTKLSAILSYSDGSTSDVSSSAAWSNTNTFVASIDTSGNVTPLRTGYTGVTATYQTFSANTGFTVTAEPRYLYFAAGLLTSKAIINGTSGQPYMAGYIPAGVTASRVFPCPTTDPLNQYLYVGSSVTSGSSGDIEVYSINPASGGLSPLLASPFPSGPVSCIDFEPSGKFGFAAVGINNSTLLVTYSRDANTGELTLNSSINLGAVPTRAAIDPLDQYVYVGASSDGFQTTKGFGYSFNSSTGALTPIPGSPFTLSNLGGTFTFHPSGNYLYMANSNGQSIDAYSVTRATGALTVTSSVATCINPTPLRFSPDGTFAYTTCSMTTSHVVSPSLESFAVGANGALTHLASTPAPELASDLTVDPSGQFLYLSTSTPYILASIIGVNGVAGPVGRIGTQVNPSLSNVVVGGPAAVHHTPRTAYISSTGDNTLSTYTVNADGTLTLLQTPPTSTPASPFSLSLWSWGTDLVLASEGASPAIDFFSLSSVTGLPAANGSLANATHAGGAAIDPSGEFAFQTDSTNGVVYTYLKLSGGGWGLVTNPGPPSSNSYPAGAGAGPIVIDPAGVLVYVANQTADSISVYEYFGTIPQLNQSTGSPFSIGAVPLLMAIDPNESFLYVICGDQTLRVFSINYFSGGAITQVASVALGAQPSGLTVTPNGSFVYVSATTGVSAYSVNAQTGALTPVALNPAITLANSTGVYAEPAGQYLYVTTGAQNVAGAVYGYSIQSDGTLKAISASPVATPPLPTSMVFLDTIQ
jgi:6-phosphogluconolactonase (cycloisomerase 2 family)